MKFNLIFLILCISIISCKNKKHKEENFSFLHLKIPVGEIEQIKMSDFISDFKAVKLEFTENSMIGDVRKIVVNNGLIYILDTFGSKSVMVFNLNGKFIRKIGNSGGGPGEYIMPKDFIIQDDRDEIAIIDNKKIYFYFFNGKFNRSSTIEFTAKDFMKLADNYFFAVGGTGNHLLFKTNNKFNITEKYLPTIQGAAGGNAFNPFIKLDEQNFLFRALLNDTIFLLNEKQFIPSRIIDFGNFKFKLDEYISKSFIEKAEILTKQTNINQCLISRYFESGNYLHMEYNMSNHSYHYVYNTESNQSVHFDKDHLSDDITFEKDSWYLIGADYDYFYYLIQPYKYKSTKQLKTFLESFTNNEIYINEILEETSNPIILMAKYKI